MSKTDNLKDFLTDIANTIRTKKGTTAEINAQNFSSEIASITTGIIPTGNINITNTNSTDVTNYATAKVVDTNLIASNIKEGVSILGITGTHEGGISGISVVSDYDYLVTLDDKNFMFCGDNTVISDEGTTTISTAGGGTYSATNLLSANIKSGVSILGKTGTYTSDATASAGNIVSGKTAYVNGSKVTGTFAAQTKTATPLTSSQTISPDSGKYLSSVTVNAIATETKSVTPSTSAQNITPTSGKYLTKVTVNAMPTGALKTATINSSTGVVTYGVSTAGYLGTQSPTLQLSTKTSQTYTPTTTDQVISAGKYLTGAQTIEGDANLVEENIRKGVSLFGVIGNYDNSIDGITEEGADTYTVRVNGTFLFYDNNEVVCEEGTTFINEAGAGSYSATNLSPENIKKGVSILGKTGTYTSDATASAGDIVSGKTAYINGSKVTGTFTAQSKTTTPTTTDQVITPDSGKYLEAVEVSGDADLVKENIRKGVNIFGVTGSYGGDTSGVALVNNVISSGTFNASEGSSWSDEYEVTSSVPESFPFNWVSGASYYVTVTTLVQTGVNEDPYISIYADSSTTSDSQLIATIYYSQGSLTYTSSAVTLNEDFDRIHIVRGTSGNQYIKGWQNLSIYCTISSSNGYYLATSDGTNPYDLSTFKFVGIKLGTITNNTSGGTSTATINAGSQLKIGSGYYKNDLYYTAASNPTLSGNASAANVVAGKTFYSNSYTKQTGTFAAETKTVTPTASTKTYSATSGKYISSFTVNGDADLVAGNIKSGVTIFGVTGTHSGGISGISVSGSDYNVSLDDKTFVFYGDNTVVSDEGTTTLSGAGGGTYSATNLSPENIKKGVTILGKTGTYTSDATAVASNIDSGKTAYVNGAKITGTSTKITPSGNINITSTSSTNVSNYATAKVVDSDLVASNIKKGVSILGVTGTYEGSSGTDTTLKALLDYTKNSSRLFMQNTSITTISSSILSSGSTANVIDMTAMFYGCTNLTTAPSFSTDKAENMSYMFYGCSSLQTVPSYNMYYVTNAESMFGGCTSLSFIDIYNLDCDLDISASTAFTYDDLTYFIYTNLSGPTSPHTLTFGSTNLAKLNSEDIAYVTEMGWTLA